MSFQDLEAGIRRQPPQSQNPFNAKRKQQNQSQDPSQAVAASIFQINTAVSSFYRLVNSLGTPKDTLELRDKLHKTRLHIGQLVKDTSSKLKEASEADHSTEVSPIRKIADAKLAKDFQSVLKEFQKAQRLAAERETTYAPFVPKEVLPSSYSYSAHEPEIISSRSSEQQLLLESKRQEVVLLDNEITYNEAFIEEREQGIKEIQEQISEVNDIFKDLAMLVHEQGVMIDDIGSNIESSHSATAQELLALSDFWDYIAYCHHNCRGLSGDSRHDTLPTQAFWIYRDHLVAYKVATVYPVEHMKVKGQHGKSNMAMKSYL